MDESDEARGEAAQTNGIPNVARGTGALVSLNLVVVCEATVDLGLDRASLGQIFRIVCIEGECWASSGTPHAGSASRLLAVVLGKAGQSHHVPNVS